MIPAGRKSPAQSQAVMGLSPVPSSFTLKYSQNGDRIEQTEELQTEGLDSSSQVCHLAAAGLVTVLPLCLPQLCCLTQPGRFALQTEARGGVCQLQVNFHDKAFITVLVLSAEHPPVTTECLELGPRNQPGRPCPSPPSARALQNKAALFALKIKAHLNAPLLPVST